MLDWFTMPPMLPEFVTKEWLSQQLGVNVKAFVAHHLGEGYMSNVFRLQVEQPGDITQPFILKLESSDETLRTIANRFGAYAKESTFYRDISKSLDQNHFHIPSCYAVSTNPWSILLEDLAEFEAISVTNGASPTQILGVTSALAELHKIKPSFLGVTLPEAIDQAEPDMSGFVSDHIATLPANKVRELALRYTRHSSDYAELFNGDAVFSHMDCRWENMRFRNNLPILFDWGEYGLAPPGFDVSYFMMTSVTKHNRQVSESDVLAHLAKALPAFDQETLFNNYRLAFLPGLYLGGLIVSSGNKAIGELMLDRALSALEDHFEWLSEQIT